jgi:hypothetical protein
VSLRSTCCHVQLSSSGLIEQADWLWSLKDWIDHKWMAMYGPQLADMADKMRAPSAAQRNRQQQAAADVAGSAAADVVASAVMRCAGCASKVDLNTNRLPCT